MPSEKIKIRTMYVKLIRVYIKKITPPGSIVEVRDEAKTIAGRTKLTASEEEACKEIFEDRNYLGEERKPDEIKDKIEPVSLTGDERQDDGLWK